MEGTEGRGARDRPRKARARAPRPGTNGKPAGSFLDFKAFLSRDRLPLDAEDPAGRPPPPRKPQTPPAGRTGKQGVGGGGHLARVVFLARSQGSAHEGPGRHEKRPLRAVAEGRKPRASHGWRRRKHHPRRRTEEPAGEQTARRHGRERPRTGNPRQTNTATDAGAPLSGSRSVDAGARDADASCPSAPRRGA